jgi:ferritin-like metal-binding protein YciE
VPAITEPRELLIAKLGEGMYVEKRLTEVIPQLADAASDGQLKEKLRHHLDETEQHLANLESIADSMGEDIAPVPSQALEGLIADHEEMMSQAEGTEFGDQLITASVLKNEHMEIAFYEGAITAAEQCGESEAVGLLRDNMKQEQHTAKEIQEVARRVAEIA